MYLFRFFIFACLFGTVSAQATVLEQHAPVDGYQNATDFSELWIPSTENEGDQSDAVTSSSSTNNKRIISSLSATLSLAICSASYPHFQSRAPPFSI